MARFAVTLGKADGTCAIFGTEAPTPILVDVPDDGDFPDGHVEAMRRAGEITGLDTSSPDSVVKRTTVEPVVMKLDLVLGRA